jgi:hypothetical protein
MTRGVSRAAPNRAADTLSVGVGEGTTVGPAALTCGRREPPGPQTATNRTIVMTESMRKDQLLRTLRLLSSVDGQKALSQTIRVKC